MALCTVCRKRAADPLSEDQPPKRTKFGDIEANGIIATVDCQEDSINTRECDAISALQGQIHNTTQPVENDEGKELEWQYPLEPISSLTPEKTVNIIGVVTSTREATRAQSGDFDWSVSVSVTDPSDSSMRINIFSQYNDWLPDPRIGDILLIRNTKIQKWKSGINGTVGKRKLMWAVYSLTQGDIRHRNCQKSVEEKFYRPEPSEIAYCVRLADWWKAFSQTAQTELMTVEASRHKLIKEVSCNEFFCCTVEILSSTLSGGKFKLVVTDYTWNPDNGTAGLRGGCGVSCSTSFLPGETIGRMVPGTFWTLSNVRLKRHTINSDIEMDLYAVKSRHIELGDNDPNFMALSRRKEISKIVDEKRTASII